MDVKLFQKARDVIADQIVGCSFQGDNNKQDAFNHAEEIIAALEAAGITFKNGSSKVMKIKLV
jgi:hypothetical protein